MVRLTDRPAMTIAVDLGRKATKPTNQNLFLRCINMPILQKGDLVDIIQYFPTGLREKVPTGLIFYVAAYYFICVLYLEANALLSPNRFNLIRRFVCRLACHRRLGAKKKSKYPFHKCWYNHVYKDALLCEFRYIHVHRCVVPWRLISPIVTPYCFTHQPTMD